LAIPNGAAFSRTRIRSESSIAVARYPGNMRFLISLLCLLLPVSVAIGETTPIYPFQNGVNSLPPPEGVRLAKELGHQGIGSIYHSGGALTGAAFSRTRTRHGSRVARVLENAAPIRLSKRSGMGRIPIHALFQRIRRSS